jgi:hypothetical protein
MLDLILDLVYRLPLLNPLKIHGLAKDPHEQSVQ